jgi:catechol 2,3-dioxygenase-like lactoylglutathione lyase family enzyme
MTEFSSDKAEQKSPSHPIESSRAGMLHHVEIYVADLERSTAFWGWLLESFGYHLNQKWDSGRSWKLGDTYLVFVQAEKKYLDIPYHRCRPGLNHLAFHARSRQHVVELTAELRRRGVKILYEDKHPHAGGENDTVYFEDPDRMKVEVVAPSSVEGSKV